MSRSEDIFERIVAQGETALDGFINDRQREELYLDFKQSADRGAGSRLHQTDRNNLSESYRRLRKLRGRSNRLGHRL